MIHDIVINIIQFEIKYKQIYFWALLINYCLILLFINSKIVKYYNKYLIIYIIFKNTKLFHNPDFNYQFKKLTIYNHLGFIKTNITESPLKNILPIVLSRFTGLAFLPLFPLGISVHISTTYSKTIFMWRSKALTLAKSFLLFLKEMATCAFDLTAFVKRDIGPTSNPSS